MVPEMSRRALKVGDPLVRSFTPPGRREFCIYAVELHEHPGVVKIGQTSRWEHRRPSYANWNLRDGDGVARECVFIVTEEGVDLRAVERAVLEAMPVPKRRGNEWFSGDFDEACRVIDRVLCGAEIS